jgi:hypothetical protein
LKTVGVCLIGSDTIKENKNGWNFCLIHSVN